MVELGPFILACHCGRCVRHVDFMVIGLVVAIGGDVDELEDEGSARDDTGAAREKVASDDVFENRGFT